MLRKNRVTASVPDAAIREPIADDAYWDTVAGWDKPSIDTGQFAELLGISAAAVRQLRVRQHGFPKPASGSAQSLTSPRAVYSWINDERPKRKGLVPRLFHSAHDLAPATFVAAERLSLTGQQGDDVDWVMHIWKPCDSRGMIALAYGYDGDVRAEERAQELLDRLPAVSAVAVVTAEYERLGVTGVEWQPQICVAERRNHGGETTVHTSRCGWLRLAALLRVNLPWWPAGLDRPDAIAAWRPGAQPQAIRPFIPDLYDESVLRNLVNAAASPGEGEQLRGTVEALNRRIEADIYRSPAGGAADVPGDAERPGLVQAAHPFYRIIDVPNVSSHELTALLTLRVPNRAVRESARRLLRKRDEVSPWVSHVMAVTDPGDPLAQQWISRLEPADDPETLGSLFAEVHLDNAEARLWWRDPKNPEHCWIVQNLDGVYFVTVGSRAFDATGQLSQFTLAEDCRSAFFADGAGVVWPMPIRNFGGHYTSGYEGVGPSELEHAATVLVHDARADVADKRHDLPTRPKMAHLIRTQQPPLHVTIDAARSHDEN